jgi:ATP-dependent 26S proteasome regulatory subunit
MEIQEHIKHLEKQLNLTNYRSDPEEYILTTDEEEAVIRFAISNLKKHKAWKMASTGLNEGAILAKIASIDWEKEIDREKILSTANENKISDLWQKQRINSLRQKKIDDYQVLQKKCNAQYFFNLMKENCLKYFNKPLQMDNDNKKLIETICYFLSRDERLESELNLDKNKGLMIRGVSGLGKTFLFELVKENDANPVKMISMIDISEAVREEGNFSIERKNERIIYLDDVGTEEATINHFGTKVNWFKEFIEKIYTLKSSFKNLVISTNLNAIELEQNYGSRVRSRMREMFNVIDVSGDDRRK